MISRRERLGQKIEQFKREAMEAYYAKKKRGALPPTKRTSGAVGETEMLFDPAKAPKTAHWKAPDRSAQEKMERGLS